MDNSDGPYSPFTFHHSPFTVHLSPFTFHHSPFTVHLSPFTFHPSPFTIHLSPIHHSPIHHSPFTFHLSPFTNHKCIRPFIYNVAPGLMWNLSFLCLYHLLQHFLQILFLYKLFGYFRCIPKQFVYRIFFFS